MKPMVFFVGASGVGKSTLATWAAREFGLTPVPSVNSQVYRDHGVTFAEAMRDPDVIYKCQREIFDRVVARFEEAAMHNEGIAADRCMDLVVYTCDMLGGWQFYQDWGLSRLEAVANDPRSLIFFVRPHPTVLEAARAADGGRRTEFLSDETVRRMDGATEMLLEDKGIRFWTIDSPRMKDRWRLVRNVMTMWRK